jgi:hypothetical protein
MMRRPDKLPRAAAVCLLALTMGTLGCLACQSGAPRQPQPGTGGSDEIGTGGSPGTGGVSGPSGTGGKPAATPDAAEADGPQGGMSGGTGGSGGVPGSADARADLMSTPDLSSSTDAYPDSAFLTGRPDIRLCKKEWTMEQCCAFLCSCLNTICADSAKAKPGLASCMSWCPKISASAARCHVYHCYISISPTGGINDHDSHCGHAANQVQGGGCPAEVAQ